MANAYVEAAAAATDPSEHEPAREVDTQEEDEGTVAVASSKDSGSDDHKRKLDGLETLEREDEAPLKKKGVSFGAGDLGGESDEAGSGGGGVEVDGAGAEESASHLGGHADGTGVITIDQAEAAEGAGNAKTDAEEEHRDNDAGIAAGGQLEMQSSGQYDGNASLPPAENTQDASAPFIESMSTSLKIEVPNSKVGILIGKAGDTIKSLQHSSGVKIQITKDAESDRQSSTRLVELIGTMECIKKAEKLIRDVIAEADAGGSPSLVARGFGTLQSGGDETEIKVPNEKVGLIIGKGGETIRNLQTRSFARIQLIPQQLTEGDYSKERTIRITGNKKQIETAKEMIKEVINQTTMRPSSLSGGYGQQNFNHWGSGKQTQWEVRAKSEHAMGSGYQQRGRYQSPQATRFTPPHGTYPHQPPPRGSFGAGWDQRPANGYDYYGGTQPSYPMPNNAALNPAAMNYNGQLQGPNYGHPAQPTPPEQNYGHGYNQPKYDGQGQQYYGQQPLGMQSSAFGQQTSAPQSGYSQQQSLDKPVFGIPTQGAPPSYPPPRASQLGDPMYQSSGTPTYGSTGPAQQSYPYGSNAPPQQSAAYNQTYAQQPAAYYQQGGQYTASGYVQGGDLMPAYSQPGVPSGGYAQYPASQQSYGDPAASNTAYGYPSAPASAGYAQAAPTTGYGTTAPAGSTQSGYVQPPANP